MFLSLPIAELTRKPVRSRDEAPVFRWCNGRCSALVLSALDAPGCAVRAPTYEEGSTVRVHLYDGRVMRGRITRIRETTSGVQITILSKQCLLQVRPDQIIRKVRG